MHNLNTLDPCVLLFLDDAGQVELKVSEDGTLAVLKELLHLVTSYDLLLAQHFQADRQLSETLFGGVSQLLRLLVIEQIQSLPQDLHDVACLDFVFNTQVATDKDEVAHEEVSDPLKFVGFETLLELVPGAPVLSRLLTDVLNMQVDHSLRVLVGVLGLPKLADLARFQYVHAVLLFIKGRVRAPCEARCKPLRTLTVYLGSVQSVVNHNVSK